MSVNLVSATLAVGALGTAATGLVDTTKAFSGGISRAGFGYIKQLIARTVPQASAQRARAQGWTTSSTCCSPTG